jgi:hypothetical protein
MPAGPLSPVQIFALAVDAGFTRGQAITMTAIGLAESGGRPDAINHNRNGTTDTGIWQINSVHGFSQSSLLDPRTNARAAKTVHDKQGFGAWVTFKNGSYMNRMNPALDAASKTSSTSIGDILKALPVAGGVLSDVTGQVAGKVASNLNPAKPLMQAVDLMARTGTFLSNPQNWLRILYVALGGALVVGALLMVTEPAWEPIVKVAGKAAKAAAL